jgi:hypothetical protein
VGPRTVLDAVVKRKIPSPCRESNPRTPICVLRCFEIQMPLHFAGVHYIKTYTTDQQITRSVDHTEYRQHDLVKIVCFCVFLQFSSANTKYKNGNTKEFTKISLLMPLAVSEVKFSVLN